MNLIRFKNFDIPYEVIRRKYQKTIRLRITPGGVVQVSTRKNVADDVIHAFVSKNAEWIHVWFSKKGIVPTTKVERNAKVKGEYVKYKTLAYEIASKKVAYWNTFYGFPYNRISIRKSETRWGSCSRKGNLQFSYKIALLPEELVDYLVVHEISHLGEFNHSKRFWELVEKAIPNYKELRKKLKGVS